MAKLPVDDLAITRVFGPHLSARTRGGTAEAPDRLVKTHCCFCGQQCGIQLKVKGNEVIGFEPWEDFPFNRGMLCPKGVKRYLQGSHPDRLLTALRRDPNVEGGFRAVGYDEAVANVGREIDRLQQAHGNACVGVLGGASLTTEKTYLLGKFARVCLKTPYIDYNGRLCMVSAGAANKKAFGIDRTTNPWSDMVGTDVIWVAGSNVAECSPITTNYIWQAREMGAKVIVQDPRITPLARTCDLYLPVRPGRDAALFAAVLGIMIEHDWIDREFIAVHTVGFDAVADYCKTWPVARAAEISGVPARSIERAAELWGTAKTSFLFHARGIEHHSNGVQNALGTINVVLASGRIGKPKSGYGTIVGQANGQGRTRARTEVRPVARLAGDRQSRSSQVHRFGVKDRREGSSRSRRRRVRAISQDRRGRDQGIDRDLLQSKGVATRQRVRRARARQARVVRRDRLLPE
jgi:assimilatory nitrate reductase catalytic subunit